MPSGLSWEPEVGTGLSCLGVSAGCPGWAEGFSGPFSEDQLGFPVLVLSFGSDVSLLPQQLGSGGGGSAHAARGTFWVEEALSQAAPALLLHGGLPRTL